MSLLHRTSRSSMQVARNGNVITGDASFCQRAIYQTIRDRQGDDLFAVKASQPTLMADLAVAFGDAFTLSWSKPRAG